MDMQKYKELARKWVKTQTDDDYLILSKFLDENFGKKKPKKRWKYYPDMKETWLYLDCKINFSNHTIESWTINEILRREMGIKYV